MNGQDDNLKDAFVRLAQVPGRAPLTRDEWVARYQRIPIKSMTAVGPDQEVLSLNMSWAMTRIGGFWFMDEECHVYVVENAVKLAVENKHFHPQADLAVATPIWVLIRKGNGVSIVSNPQALKVAENNFMKYLDEVYKQWRKNG